MSFPELGGASSSTDIRFHLIWPTRRRRPFLRGPILHRVVELFVEAAATVNSRVVRAISGANFIIVTVDASPEASPASIAKRLKRHSAGRLRREFAELRSLPSIWTRELLATTRDAVSADQIAGLVGDRHDRPEVPDLCGTPQVSEGEVEILQLAHPDDRAVPALRRWRRRF